MSWGKLSQRQRAKLRLAVFERDNWLCQLAYEGTCTLLAEVADHVNRRETHGDGLDNLQAACRPCNYRKGKPKAVDPGHEIPRGAWW